MTRARPGLIALVFAAALAAAPRARAETRLLVVTGVAGDEDDAKQFARWATALVDAATTHGVPAADIVYLGDGRDSRQNGRSTRENVTRAFQELAGRAQPDDEVVIVLIGHGSFDGRNAAFNLPGPDLSAGDFAKLLQAIRANRIAFVNTAAASGAFVPILAGPGRAIVAATATGGERNDTRFPEYFVGAFTSPDADRDHDGRVSLREAFEYARAKVGEAYKQAGLLQTEHAKLEDGADGAFASTLTLGAPAAGAAADPALRTLIQEREQLESRVAALRQRKAEMGEASYDAELEQLLVQLAEKTRAIRQLQEKK